MFASAAVTCVRAMWARVVMIVALSAIALTIGGGSVLAWAPGSSGDGEGSDTFPWPVAIIGGAVIIGGLVALRGEFRNWRQRRSDRA